jgi:hypothetical protein
MTAQAATQELVFDTGPLSHFAEQGWLGALRFVLDGRVAIAPDTVIAELKSGLHAHPHLRLVLDVAEWAGPGPPRAKVRRLPIDVELAVVQSIMTGRCPGRRCR